MNDRQENFLSMNVAVKTTCDGNASVWNGTPYFVTHYSNLNTKISELQALKTAQELDIKGFTLDKGGKKNDMISQTMTLINALVAFARAENNMILLEEVNYTKTDLDRARDEIIVSKCQIVQDRAITYMAQLAGINITNQMIIDHQASIGVYSAVSQMPSTKEDERQVITTQIDSTIGQIRDIFKILDPIAKTFSTVNATFMQAYFNSREIYDLGGGGTETQPPTG